MAVRTLGRVVFLIPARGGSRRIPGKNLRSVAGIPLVGHAIRTARSVAHTLPRGQNAVVVSTDDDEIASTARAWGADSVIHRPDALAGDTATSASVALHALDELDRTGPSTDVLVLVQPTSPLTDPTDVEAALRRFGEVGSRPIVSVSRAHPAGWHRSREPGTDVLREVAADRADPGDPTEWVLTGAFYIVAPDALRASGRFVEHGRAIGFEVPRERSIDIDEPADLLLAEQLAAIRPIRRTTVDGHEIGGDRPFVIAEAGVNHNGEPALAHRLIDAAADAGAAAVKFQTFEPEALAAALAPTAEYQRRAGVPADQREMLLRLALPPEIWPALKAHATERGVTFLSTPFDEDSAALLERLNVPAFKVGSGDVTNVPFLERLARTGRPLLVSTGMADMVEVATAVDAVRAAGNADLVLLHCVSSYPARIEDANLQAMITMRTAFGVPTGWSDHTPGTDLPLAATALGAAVIEKHLTLDRSMSGPDHAASLEPAEFAAVVDGVRAVASALGTGIKAPVAAEAEIATLARRSLHWRRALHTGDVVRTDDLVALRPANGISPARQGQIVGRRLSHPVEEGSAVADADLDRDS
jgi:N-acetylneuraminate synthase/N,N'-diacetyllegionaminate synthase